MEPPFYVDLETDRVIWMYHNTDAVSGDQFVCNIFDKDLLKEAIQECPIGPDSGFEPTPVFDYLAENCRQYLSDVGEIAYDANKERFESPDFGPPSCQTFRHLLSGQVSMDLPQVLITEFIPR